MEALIILLADLIILPMTLFATLLAQTMVAFASCLASFLEAVFGITFSLRKKDQQLSPEALELLKQKTQRRRKFMKRLSWTLGSVLVLMVTIVCLANFLFFDSVVRWGFAHVEKRSGVQIGFASAAGSFFSGELTLKQVTAKRQENAVSNFDLRADEFSLNLSMTKLLARSSQIEKVLISGLKGEFHRVTAPERMKIRKRYEVGHFRLKDSEIDIRDSSRTEEAQFTVKITELDSQPLRSHWAVFDILFRSNASGEIAGRPFLIQMKKTENGRQTFWQADGLPVAFVGKYLGGPFDWLTGGTIDVRVEDKWELSDNADIKMHWRFVLRDLVVSTPKDSHLMNRMIASTIAEYFRRNAKELDVNFSLTLNESQFEGAASADAAGLWDATREGLVSELNRLSGVDPDRLNRGIDTGIDFIKKRLENSGKKSP